MRRTLVRGDPVIGMSSGIAPISNGAVIVEDGLVAAIGTADALADQGRFDEVLGSPGHVVLPGLVNAHHHGGRTFRSGLPELPFERRSLYLHLLLASGTEEGSYRNTLYSCMELLRNGVTSVAVVFYPNVALPEAGAEAVLQAYLDSGMRVAFAVAQRDRALYVHEDDDRFCATLPSALAARLRASALGRYSQRSLSNPEYFRLIRGLFKRWHGRDDRIRIDAGPDWFPSCSDELLIESRRFADDFGTHIQLHLLETRYEMLMARRWYGESAIQHLVGLGVLGPDVVCAHSVWVTDDDIALYADTGAIAVHNPASNLRLASGVAPVRAFLERGASVAFGCDGLSLADDNDLLSDLRLADQLQRIPGIAAEPIPARTLLHMATGAGARAMGMPERIGELRSGACADLVLLRKDRFTAPYVHPETPIDDVILVRARGEDVDAVMIGGRIVVRDGRCTEIDEQELARELAGDAHAAFAPSAARDEARALARELEPYVVRFLEAWDWPQPEPAYRYNTR